jgi:serine/threonine protein kinase
LVEGTPFGRYRLIELLGRGGMGEVWRAYDTDSDRIVAVKVLPEHFVHDKTFQQRFLREARSAAGLNEPHVVPIHRYGEIEGRLYVDMRLIEGQDLQALLTHGRLEPARAVAIIDQVASALEAAHRIGLVHRDVKPSNILVAAKDFAYLIDFGIARAAGETKLTGTGNVIGTWAYLAPERVTSGQTDPRADIYSLTCVLHECLTGSQPFPGDSIEQQIGGHLGLPPPRPSLLRDDLPAELDTVIATGMAKNPDDRYSTVSAMADAARAAITTPIIRPTAMPPTEPARHNQLPTMPAAPPSPPDSTPDGAPPTDPTRSAAAQQGQPSVHTDPTRQRPANNPNLGTLIPDGSAATARGNFWKGHRVAITGVIAVVVVLAVVATIVVSNSGDSSPAATSQTPIALPNTGPFTGTFTADFGPLTKLDGSPGEGPPPGKETWNLRSVCGASGCVATASRASGDTSKTSEMVFDDVGGRWLAVAETPWKCNSGAETTLFVVFSLQPRPDGTSTGDYSYDSNACGAKRTVTFTRTGDARIDLLDDPASLPARVVSPAQALHGRYHATIDYTSTNTMSSESDYAVRTACLRTGERCLSDFITPGTMAAETFVFANGKWTRNSEFDSACSAGGTSHAIWSSVLPLPQPPQDPITLLSGSGHVDSTGSACTGGDFDEKFVRTGD